MIRGPIFFVLIAVVLTLAAPVAAQRPLLVGSLEYSRQWSLEQRTWSLRFAPKGHPGRALASGILFSGTAPSPGLQIRPWIQLDLKEGDGRQLDPRHLSLQPLAKDERFAPQIGIRSDLQFEHGLSAHLDFRFDQGPSDDPRTRTRSFGQLDAANNLDHAFLQWRGESMVVVAGRFPVAWGPSPRGGLLLSGYGPAPDLVMGQMKFGPHRLGALSGQLSSIDGKERWIYAHRIDLELGHGTWGIGLSEAAVVSGSGFSLRYANPLAFLAQVQAEDHGDDPKAINVLHALDASGHRGPFRLYGELVIDDLQIDRSARRRKADQLAVLVGVDVAQDRARGWLASYEFRRANGGTFVHADTPTEWSHFGAPLGMPEGSDLWLHNLRIEKGLSPGPKIWLEAETEGRRNRQPGLASLVGPEQQRRQSLRAGLEWSRGETTQAALGAAWHSVESAGGLAGEDPAWLEIHLRLLVLLPELSWAP